jgi:hypothetical protein
MTSCENHILVKRIWDHASYCAFTDLIYFKGMWFCAFRESDAHQNGRNGTIRVIASKDTHRWKTVGYFFESDVDLRDPKLSETPEGRLMLLCGGTIYQKQKGKKDRYISRQPRVSFSTDGENWSSFTLVLEPHEWLWRVTWHQGKAYGASYRQSNIKYIRRKWIITLYESHDGIHYQKITQWPITRYPNETTLRFLETGEMIALVRRENRWTAGAWIGISKSPYTKWRWRDSLRYFGGPNFLILPDNSMIASGRLLLKNPYGIQEKTIVAKMTLDILEPFLVLPSGGDTSYPGMVYREKNLWVSYYSSHEHKTAIYLAKIPLHMHLRDPANPAIF